MALSWCAEHRIHGFPANRWKIKGLSVWHVRIVVNTYFFSLDSSRYSFRACAVMHVILHQHTVVRRSPDDNASAWYPQPVKREKDIERKKNCKFIIIMIFIIIFLIIGVVIVHHQAVAVSQSVGHGDTLCVFIVGLAPRLWWHRATVSWFSSTAFFTQYHSN